MSADFSVVIPSYNSASTMHACLLSLRGQDFAGKLEVIVVDSGEDEAADIISEQFPEVQLVKWPHRIHQAEARNIGLGRASASIVGFLDSDCVARPDWVREMLSLHEEHPEVAAVTGTVLNGTRWHPIGTLSYLMEFNEFVPGSPERYIEILLGGNLSVKKIALSKAGLRFPDIYHSEDTLLAARILDSGHKILFSPRVAVYHLNRRSYWALLRHAFTLGKASARARKRANLYGHWLRRFPVLCAVLPFARWARGLARLLRFNRGYAAAFLLLTPLYLVAAYSWSLAFGIELVRDDSTVPATSRGAFL